MGKERRRLYPATPQQTTVKPEPGATKERRQNVGKEVEREERHIDGGKSKQELGEDGKKGRHDEKRAKGSERRGKDRSHQDATETPRWTR